MNSFLCLGSALRPGNPEQVDLRADRTINRSAAALPSLALDVAGGENHRAQGFTHRGIAGCHHGQRLQGTQVKPLVRQKEGGDTI
jgi:hypothetical protein